MADYSSFAGASKAFRKITGKAFERIGGTDPISQNIYQSTELVPVYQYATLRRSKSIRLIGILPGGFDECIRCSLEEVSIDSKLRYDALSYTWGEPIFDKTILISKPQSLFKGYTKNRDKQWYSLGVTQSLYDALLHIRREDVEVKLWADAVCIDQGNLDERSSQVQLMGQIYNRAACVRVWLGRSDEASEVAFSWVMRAFAEIRDYQTVDGVFDIERYLRQTAGRPPRHDLVKDLRDQAITNALLATFSDAHSRKWWSRCWILQEIVNSHKAMIMCGRLILDWQVLERVGEAILALSNSHSSSHVKAADIFTQLRRIQLLRISRTMELSANGLLRAVGRSNATDPRDHVYALLSLHSSLADAITPDYRKGIIDVYIDGIMAVIAEQRDLEVFLITRLIHSEDQQIPQTIGKDTYIPSWVVDFGRLGGSRLETIPSDYFADGSLVTDCRLSRCCQHPVLRLTGVSCDEVSRIAKTASFTDAVFEHIFRLTDIDDLIRVVFWDCEVQIYYPYGVAQRFTADSLARYKKLLAEAEPEINHDAQIRTALSSAIIEGESSYLALETLGRNLGTQSMSFLYRLRSLEGGWRLCIFKSGRIGWVYDSARPGDLVYVLFGSPVPLLLRPVARPGGPGSGEPDIHATLVGETYVQGVMDGEMVKGVRVEDLRVVCLH